MHMLVLLLAALTSVQLPPYESIRHIDHYATRAEYESAAKDKRFSLKKVSYASDGLEVFSYVYEPVKAKEKLPVIVFNRGSFVREEFAPELLAMFHRLGEAGFIVVAPMYRQSGGSAGRDELGGADLADLMNVTSVIATLPSADSRNTFLYGESRGGMMTFQAVRDRFPARAAATFGGFTDLGAMIASNPQARKMADTVWPDYATNAAVIHERRSAVVWAGKIGVPLLIMQGGDDHGCLAVTIARTCDEAAGAGQAIRAHHSRRIGSRDVGLAGAAGCGGVDWFRRHMAE